MINMKTHFFIRNRRFGFHDGGQANGFRQPHEPVCYPDFEQ
jgi:hypothetical protein